jgi:hypothetical protein
LICGQVAVKLKTSKQLAEQRQGALRQRLRSELSARGGAAPLLLISKDEMIDWNDLTS